MTKPSKFRAGIILLVILAISFVGIRGAISFNTHQTFKYKGLCVSNFPGYFVSEDISNTSAFYSISKYNFDKSAIYIGSDFDRIQYESYHFRKFLRLANIPEEINVLATSEAELSIVTKMVQPCK